LKVLGDEGLLEIIDEVAGKDIWAKTAIDKSLRISKFLCEEFELDRDGQPMKGRKRKSPGKTISKKRR